MAAPTDFKPTIVAGVRQLRSFTRGFGNWRFRYRTALQITNRSAAATLILYVNGEEVRRIPPGTLLATYDEDVRIEYYELDATANTAADEVQVIEHGGLDESVESQLGLPTPPAYGS